MKTEEKSKFDKDGYLMLPKKFSESGWSFEYVKDLEDGWCIYKRFKTNDKSYRKIHWELILPYKQEEAVICGRKLEKKWKYPNTNSFGRRGRDCISERHCEEAYLRIIEKREENDKEFIPPILPKTRFTIPELLKDFPDYSNSEINKYIKELIANKKLEIVGEKKNKVGRNSKYYQITK